MTIGIELNHVVRNINGQMLKYYAKDIDPSIDIEEINDKEDVLEKYLKFPSKHDKNEFIYIDYPYEIFGCAKTMEKNLPTSITNWLSDISDIEDKEIKIIFYSLGEEALTIQSSYFFLSRIGTRVREVIFPTDLNEVWDKCDAVITANKSMVESKPQGKKVVLIKRPFNECCETSSDLVYESLTDIISDKDFFDKL